MERLADRCRREATGRPGDSAFRVVRHRRTNDERLRTQNLVVEKAVKDRLHRTFDYGTAQGPLGNRLRPRQVRGNSTDGATLSLREPVRRVRDGWHALCDRPTDSHFAMWAAHAHAIK